MNYIAIIQQQLNAMAVGIVATVPNLVIAAIILFITWMIAKLAVRIADRLIGSTHVRENLKQLVETLVRLGIWIIGLLIAAAIVIPGFTPAGLIAGLGIGAVAIGFAFQDIFQNFLAGVLIMLREKMRIGDSVESDGISGKVEKITLRETHIRQFSGELTIVPNSSLFKNPVKILTDEPLRRDEVMVGVAYDADLEQGLATIRRAFDGIEGLAANRKPAVLLREFGDSSVNILVQWWVDTARADMGEVKNRVMLAIKRELDREQIEIPFPYVTHTFKDDVPVHPVGKGKPGE